MKEKILSLIFVLFSFGYLHFAREFAFGAVAAPKAGFLPTIAAVIACVLSTVLFAVQVSREPGAAEEKINWRKFAFIVLGLVAFILLMKITTYILATFVVMLYLLKVGDSKGWRFPVGLSAVTALTLYFLFVRVLDVTALP